ncbi:MAG: hypothetical protein JW958_02675 [Candidatus Eisenbacteria bacterium]|nr:hypothetical protein [Candidatus Eisenbacteria bacterium]
MSGTGAATRGVILLAAALALFCFPPLTAAQTASGDEEFEEVRTDSIWILDLEGDSLWVDSLSADSIRAYVVQESLAAIPSVSIAKVKEGFHPSWTVRASDIRGNSNLSNEFKLDYALRDNMIYKNQVTLERRRSGRADRTSSSQEWKNDVQYLFHGNMKLGLGWNRRTSNDDDQRQTIDLVRDMILLRAIYSRDLWRGIRLTLNMNGGVENRNKTTDTKADGSQRKEEKRGNSKNANVLLNYSPSPDLDVEFSGDFQRKGFSLTTSGTNVEEKENPDNNDRTDNATFRLRFDKYELCHVKVNASADDKQQSFAKSTGAGTATGEVETVDEWRRSFDVQLSGDVTEATGYEANARYSAASRRYRIDKGQSSDLLDYGAEVALNQSLPARVRSRLVLKRSVGEDTYYPDAGMPDRTGKADNGSMVLNLSRTLWNNTRLRAAGSLQMTSRSFVDSTQDKDDLISRVSFDLNYEPEGKLRGGAQFSLDENRTVNIHSSRASNNQTRQTWMVAPTVEYAPIPSLKFRSSYRMSLVYIFKDVDEDLNTMTRISELRSTAGWAFARGGSFDFEYRFKLNESGSFEKEGSTRRFARDREDSNQKLTLRVSYTLPGDMRIESGQFVEVVKRYSLNEGKTLEQHDRKLQIYNQVSWRRSVTGWSRLVIQAKQSQDAAIPLFTRTGVLRDETHRTEWELQGTFTIEM